MLNDEQMSNKVRVEHPPDKRVNVHGAKERVFLLVQSNDENISRHRCLKKR